MKGKNKSNNVYCETCKKFHKKGLHSRDIIDPLVKGDPKALMSFMRRANSDLYIMRNRVDDADEFKESDIVKEDDKDGTGRNRKKDK